MLTETLKSRFHEQIYSSLSQYMVQSNEAPYYSWFMEDVENQFLMELLKMDYDNHSKCQAQTLRKHRIKHDGDGTHDDHRQSDYRELIKIKRARGERATQLKALFGYCPAELSLENKTSFSQKLEGYKITDVQYQEMQLMNSI